MIKIVILIILVLINLIIQILILMFPNIFIILKMQYQNLFNKSIILTIFILKFDFTIKLIFFDSIILTNPILHL